MAKLAIICGHGAGDPGAGGCGYEEAERVRALGYRIKELGGDEVDLLDTSRDWYRDAGIDELSIDSPLVELHMDCDSGSARGGHVIIKAGIGGPDGYDNGIAGFISSMFPGRADAIVERGNLANANRAYRRGINYRLVEHGFIDNQEDVDIFNSRLDDIARAYLEVFGIAKPKPTSAGVHLHTPNGTPAQQWRFVSTGRWWTDEAGIKCPICNLVPVCREDWALDVAGGSMEHRTPVRAWPQNGTPAQEWIIEKIDNPVDSFLHIRCAKDPNMSLATIGGGTASGTGVVIGRHDDALCHHWTAVWMGGGYALHPQMSDMALDVDKGGN